MNTSERLDLARFHANLLDAVSQAIVVTDPNGSITLWNRAAEELYGWPAAEVLDRPIMEVTPSEEDADQAAAIMVSLSEGCSWSGEIRLRRKDGSTFIASASATPVFDEEGALVAVIGVSVDLTERKKAEEMMLRLSGIVEHSGDAIVGTSLDGTIESWNDAAESLYGYTAAEAIGQPLTLVVPPDREAEMRDVLAAVKRDDPVTKVETVRMCKDGRLIEVSITASPIFDGTGALVGASAIVRDITDRRRTERAIVESRAQLAEAQRIAQLGSFERDLETGQTLWSDELHRITGIDPTAPHNAELYLSAVHPAYRRRLRSAMRRVAELGEPLAEEHRIVRPDGTVRWVQASAAMVASDGVPARIVGAILDITERRRAELERERAETLFRTGYETAAIGMAMADLEGRFTSVNPAACELFARSEEEILGHRPGDFTHPDDVSLGTSGERRLLAGELDRYEMEKRYVRPSGEIVWAGVTLALVRDDAGRPAFFYAQMQDITARKRTEHQLEHQALHDLLTGLPNRLLLTDRLSQAIATAERHDQRVAVMFLDIDHFKLVNDSLGHGAGDRMLVEVARRLEAAVRPGDTVARFGGDEFVLVCEAVSTAEAKSIGERVRAALRDPVSIEGRELFVSASIGIALASASDSPDGVLRDADAAMYRAKERGRSRAEVFDEGLRRQAVARLDLESAMRRALELNEFTLAYQPVMDLGSERIVGVEALLRWPLGDGRVMGPNDFVPLAEQTGLIVPLGEWVMREALRQVQEWRTTIPGAEHLAVAVNLSAKQLTAPGLTATVARAVRAAGIDHRAVHFEITETVVMDDVEVSIDALRDLRALGVGFAVDDFGTGYSSLSYLKRLPVDTLKIDRAFVDGLGTDPHDSSIVNAVIGLGQALDLTVLAEGVETRAQLDELRSLGCQLAQGHYWTPALDAEQLRYWMLDHRPM